MRSVVVAISPCLFLPSPPGFHRLGLEALDLGCFALTPFQSALLAVVGTCKECTHPASICFIFQGYRMMGLLGGLTVVVVVLIPSTNHYSETAATGQEQLPFVQFGAVTVSTFCLPS
ncbi:hypothetical protein ABZP36_019239 [Zizania latifolia]